MAKKVMQCGSVLLLLLCMAPVSWVRAQSVQIDGNQILVSGTTAADDIVVRPHSSYQLVVLINGIPRGPNGQQAFFTVPANVTSLRIDASSGDDDLILEAGSGVYGPIDVFDLFDSVQMIGGTGNDRIDPGFLFPGAGQSLLLVGDLERRIAFPWYFPGPKSDTIVRYYTFFNGRTSVRTDTLADYYPNEDGDRTEWIAAGWGLGY